MSANSSDFGTVGLIDVPTARMSPDGIFTVSSAIQSRTNSYSITYQLAPRVETTFRYTGWNEAEVGYDRNYGIKFKLFSETSVFPEVSVGIRDLVGTGLWGTEYLVASKAVGNLDLTFGMGWGRLAGRSNINNPLVKLSDKFSTRPTDFGYGGKLSYRSFFSGETVGFFGGLSYSLPSQPITFMVEYNPDTYSYEVERGGNSPHSPLSAAIKWDISPMLTLNFSRQHSEEWGIGVSAKLDTKSSSSRSRLRSFLSSKDFRTGKLPYGLNKDSWYDLLLFDVERSGILMLEATIDERTKSADIVMGNLEYSNWRDALETMIRLADLHLPKKIENLRLGIEEEGHRLHSINVKRPASAHFLSSKNAKSGYSINRFRPIEIPSYRTEFFTGKAIFDINLATRFQFFDPDDPARYQLYLKTDMSFILPNKWILRGTYDFNIENNFDESSRVSDSRLQKVRTDVVKYLTEGDSGLDSLYLERRGNISSELYFRVFGGVLESMYSGFGGEVLYQPYRSRLAYGLSINSVQQRAFDKSFEHLSYKTTTGFASLYWAAPFYNLDIAMHIGKYLARDYGATLEFRRTFDNGWMIGAWATFTNVSSQEFGEGSFDKGLFFKVPLDIFSAKASRRDLVTRLRPIQRDGGQRLEDFSANIWWYTRSARFDVFND